MNLIQGIATIIITLLGSGVVIVPAISATYNGWAALII
jgi:amino acid efflux transporter